MSFSDSLAFSWRRLLAQRKFKNMAVLYLKLGAQTDRLDYYLFSLLVNFRIRRFCRIFEILCYCEWKLDFHAIHEMAQVFIVLSESRVP